MGTRTGVISFYFPLENPSLLVHLEAAVEIERDEYRVYNFRVLDDTNTAIQFVKGPDLPKMVIKPVLEDEHLKWVHTDSGTGTLMSESIGSAIEVTLTDCL